MVKQISSYILVAMLAGVAVFSCMSCATRPAIQMTSKLTPEEANIIEFKKLRLDAENAVRARLKADDNKVDSIKILSCMMAENRANAICPTILMGLVIPEDPDMKYLGMFNVGFERAANKSSWEISSINLIKAIPMIVQPMKPEEDAKAKQVKPKAGPDRKKLN